MQHDRIITATVTTHIEISKGKHHAKLLPGVSLSEYQLVVLSEIECKKNNDEFSFKH